MSEPKPATGSGRQPARDDIEVRSFPFDVEEVRAAEGGRSTDYTVKGHAAVFNTWTDLGVFKERVAKGAFDGVLGRAPHVLHTWDHDTSKTLSSTQSKPVTLELRTDPRGLHFWSRVDGELSYAKDLRRLLERGIVSQSSFAFTVARDEWKERGDGDIERTILEVGELVDVTTTAMGAYPTTDSQVAMRTLEHARALAKEMPESHPAVTAETAAPPDEGEAGDGTETPPDEDGADSEAITPAQDSVARDGAALFALKRQARRDIQEARELQDQLEKDMKWK